MTTKSRYQELKNNGICTQCASKEARTGKTKCQKCVDYNKLNTEAKKGLPCSTCKQNPRPSFSNRCKECARLYGRVWYRKQKQTTLEYYGGKCVCCGEDNEKFLTIDHVYNDGFEYRKKMTHKIWRWAINNNFPDTLQILCWNCNMGKAHNNGVCPHKDVVKLEMD